MRPTPKIAAYCRIAPICGLGHSHNAVVREIRDGLGWLSRIFHLGINGFWHSGLASKAGNEG